MAPKDTTMEIQEVISIAERELEKAVGVHKKYGTVYAVVQNQFTFGPNLLWGHFVVGYSFYVEKVYRHNGTNKDCSVRILVTDNHENGSRANIYVDKFKISLTDKTILKKIQKAVEFVIALPEKDRDRIHGYAGPIGQVSVPECYDYTLDKGVEFLDEKCRVTNKIELTLSYDEYHEIYGDRPWEVSNSQNAPEKVLARQLSEITGVTSNYLH